MKKSIIIEGPIGVGKSSLAKRLSDSYQLPLLNEQPAINPFLEPFYSDPKRYALAVQLSFLLQRKQQLISLAAGFWEQGYVSDFMLQKDPIFAKNNLSADEFSLYQQIYDGLNLKPHRPDLIIYLQAPVDVLIERINKRKVPFELGMDRTYLLKLSDAYTEFFHAYNDGPLLIVNASEINPVDNDEHFGALLKHIEGIDAGKHYFNPLADS